MYNKSHYLKSVWTVAKYDVHYSLVISRRLIFLETLHMFFSHRSFTIFAEGKQDHVAAFSFVLIQIELNRALGNIMDIIPRKGSKFQIDVMSSLSPYVKPVLIGQKGCWGWGC